MVTSLHPRTPAQDSIPLPQNDGPQRYVSLRHDNDFLNLAGLQATGTLGLQVKNFSIEYDQVYQTKEFRTVYSHVYGAVLITWKI